MVTLSLKIQNFLTNIFLEKLKYYYKKIYLILRKKINLSQYTFLYIAKFQYFLNICVFHLKHRMQRCQNDDFRDEYDLMTFS